MCICIYKNYKYFEIIINYKYIMSLVFSNKHGSAFIKQISMQIYNIKLCH